MKLSQLSRREFIESMLLVGLAACGPAGRRVLRSSPRGPGANGWLFDRLALLSDDLAAGAIGPQQFVRRAGERLMELELEPDVLEAWLEQGPSTHIEGLNGYRTIHTRPLPFGERKGALKAVLFYTPAGISNPPHEHHNLMSVKRVLKGSYHVREYERVRDVEPGVMAIRQVSDRQAVGFAGPCVEMTDDYRAVHWFGAGREPVLALNIVVENALPLAATFHGIGERRETGRYFVDPTGEPDAHGVILTRAITHEEALLFTRLPLSDFPSRLRAEPSKPS